MAVIINGMEMPKNCKECPCCYEGELYVGGYPVMFPCVCHIKRLPIKPSETDLRDGLCPLEPVIHGHWIVGKYPLCECSRCGALVECTGNEYYCPSCGARMDIDE